MIIGMFSDTYYPQKNGVATAVKLYKDWMSKYGNQVYVFAPEYSSKFKREEENVIEFPAIQFPFEKEHRIAVPFSTELFKLKDFNFDIIHSHTPFSLGILAEIVSRIHKLPLVGTYHTMYEYYRHYLPPIMRPTMSQTKRMIRDWCLRTDKVISPTQTIKDILMEYGVPENHIEVIPTGLDLSKFKKEIKFNIFNKYNIPKDRKIMLFVGRLAKEKNIDFLIKLLPQIKKEIKNILFIIVGEGPERENLQDLVEELNLNDNVLFTGALMYDEVIDVYKQADIFVFASYTETQGLVIVEALASGLPVVALGEMGVKDILSNPNCGGVMIERLNEEDFIMEIIKILKEENLKKELSEKGKKFVEENYSIETTTSKILDLYKEVKREFEIHMREHRFWWLRLKRADIRK